MNSPRDAEELFNPETSRPDGTEIFLDKPVNASDVPALKQKALNDKQRALKEENDLRAVLATPEGVRFVARLITACGWNTPHFHTSNSVMCEVAGRRSIAWQVEQWISDTELSLWFAVRRELETVRPKPKTSERSR